MSILTNPRVKKNRWMPRATALGAAALLLPALAACTPGDTTVEGEDDVIAEEPATEEPTAEEFSGDGPLSDEVFAQLQSGEWDGQTVTLEGIPDQVYSPQHFTLIGPEVGDTEQLLVLHDVSITEDDQTLITGMEQGLNLRVTGVVNPDFQAIDAEGLNIEIDEENLSEWEGEPWLQAESIELLDEEAVIDE